MEVPMTDRHPALVARDALTIVVVDVQERLAAVMDRRDEVTAAAGLLVRVAGVLGVPVIVTRQNPRGLGDTVAELRAALDEASEAGAPMAVVDKLSFDCTCEPAFGSALAKAGRSHVVLTGMETHICVSQTALSLAAAGMTPHVVADACCSRRDRDRDVALDRLRAEGVDVLPSESVIYEALGVAGTDEFRRVLELVKRG
jgi:nicotinamidase-related amidase